MKTFSEYLNEEYQFKISHNQLNKIGHKYFPKTKDELVEAIEKEIEIQGNGADLNCIDVSNITDMSHLFNASKHRYAVNFNGDISSWDVSKVTIMVCMFERSKFNGDISNWDVSNVKDMSAMFFNAESFNQDISKWDVSNVENMDGMFYYANNFNGDISNWNVSNVKNMNSMFCHAESFNQDISKWNVSKVENIYGIFSNCPIKEEYKPKFK